MSVPATDVGLGALTRRGLRFARGGLCGAALTLFVLGPVAARPIPEATTPPEPDEAPTAFVAQRGSISLQQATEIARRRYPGRVVKAETTSRGERIVHEIRILDQDGRTVRTVRIDAETGQFL